MAVYKCNKCKYTFEAEGAPEACPDCGRSDNDIEMATEDEVEAWKLSKAQAEDDEQTCEEEYTANYHIDGYRVAQIKLPDPHDADSHPRLMFRGYGIHAGEIFWAWLPDGWREIRLEMTWKTNGPGCWFIPGLPDICPVGLWCRCD